MKTALSTAEYFSLAVRIAPQDALPLGHRVRKLVHVTGQLQGVIAMAFMRQPFDPRELCMLFGECAFVVAMIAHENGMDFPELFVDPSVIVEVSEAVAIAACLRNPVAVALGVGTILGRVAANADEPRVFQQQLALFISCVSMLCNMNGIHFDMDCLPEHAAMMKARWPEVYADVKYTGVILLQ